MIRAQFKILLLFLIVAVGTKQTQAQNLVPNPSFEDTISCPIGLADISKAALWSAPTEGSPDYFHSCNNGDVSIPINIIGTQSALTGNAYSGVTVYDTWITWSYREYIQVQLLQTLISGQKYWVSFYVSLADSAMYAIQELGAYFSPIQINDNSMDTTLSFTPQIEFSDSIIMSKNDWIKVRGSFTANGNENYLIIGNFNRSQNTTASLVGNGNQNFSYYYVDNVCVSSDSLTCNQPVGANEIELNSSSFKLYPNPSIDFFTINNTSNQSYNIIIYNSIGQHLFEEMNINSSTKKIDITNFNSNLLFIKIETQNQTIIYKHLNL